MQVVDLTAKSGFTSPTSTIMPPQYMEQAKSREQKIICVVDAVRSDNNLTTKGFLEHHNLIGDNMVIQGFYRKFKQGDMLIVFSSVTVGNPAPFMDAIMHDKLDNGWEALRASSVVIWSPMILSDLARTKIDKRMRIADCLNVVPNYHRYAWKYLRREQKKTGKVAVGGSDASLKSGLYRTLTKFTEPVETPEEFVRALKNGSCEPMYYDLDEVSKTYWGHYKTWRPHGSEKTNEDPSRPRDAEESLQQAPESGSESPDHKEDQEIST